MSLKFVISIIDQIIHDMFINSHHLFFLGECTSINRKYILSLLFPLINMIQSALSPSLLQFGIIFLSKKIKHVVSYFIVTTNTKFKGITLYLFI